MKRSEIREPFAQAEAAAWIALRSIQATKTGVALFCLTDQTSARSHRAGMTRSRSTVHGVVFEICARTSSRENAKRSNPAGLVAGLLRRWGPSG
jgi:hypothetical protein